MLGNKIDNLKLLLKNGFNVPDFFVIKFDDVVNIDTLNIDLSDIKKASINLKQNLKDNINIKINKSLNTNLYAVRSSCNIEDGDKYSFAGQFDTYLNVHKEELKEKITDCFLSLYNENVLTYLKENNISLSDIKMNVIVQKMICSDLSGVFFTSNPQGIINESVIVVSKGLGENVVEDKGDVTSYYYNNTDNIYYYEGKDILCKNNIDLLINEANEIIKILGHYLDIEFAFCNDKLYILQVRKITTIDDDNLLVMDNSNIVESYPNISLPITISYVNEVYSMVFKNLVTRVLKNENKLNDLNKIFNNMTGSVNGRIYYKISNWYTLLKFLPFSNKIIPIWQEMLGVKIKKVSTNNVKVSKFIKIKIMFNYLNELFRVKKNMNDLNNEFIKINNYFNNNFKESLSNKEILKIYKTVENKLLNNWEVTLINDMYSFIYTGLLKKRLKKKYKNDYENITNEYISGISNIESLKPIKKLIYLAYIENEVSKEEFDQMKKDYISIYGDRSLEELKIESQTFRTDNKLLDEKIKEYQKDKVKLNTIYNSLNENKNIKLNDDLLTKHLIKKVDIGISNREISRLNRSRVFGMVRSMVTAIGKNLEKQRILNSYKDIFYLTIDEIKKIDKVKNIKDLINKRKEEYIIYEKLPAYSRLIFVDKEFNKSINNISLNKELYNDDIIKGIPCSFGIVEGKVLVIDNINDIQDVKDKILVTKMTDPGWVFLLATAKGIISEKGSLLSHTSIIARELKIPSIVGVDKLMKKLKTDDYIKMDANTGIITIIKRS